MPSPMIALTDYHVSRTLGYVDAYVRFTDAIAGTINPPPIPVPLSDPIRAKVAELDALLCQAVEAELKQRDGADPALTVVPFSPAKPEAVDVVG